jgi:hypothetical protein
MQAFFGILSVNLTAHQAEMVYSDLLGYLGIAISLNLIGIGCRIWSALKGLGVPVEADRAIVEAIDGKLNAFREAEGRLIGERTEALKVLERVFVGVGLVTAHRKHRSGSVIRPAPILRGEGGGGDRLTSYRAEKERTAREFEIKMKELEVTRDHEVGPLFRQLMATFA